MCVYIYIHTLYFVYIAHTHIHILAYNHISYDILYSHLYAYLKITMNIIYNYIIYVCVLFDYRWGLIYLFNILILTLFWNLILTSILNLMQSYLSYLSKCKSSSKSDLVYWSIGNHFKKKNISKRFGLVDNCNLAAELFSTIWDTWVGDS